MEGVIFRLERQKSNFEEEATLKKSSLSFKKEEERSIFGNAAFPAEVNSSILQLVDWIQSCNWSTSLKI